MKDARGMKALPPIESNDENELTMMIDPTMNR